MTTSENTTQGAMSVTDALLTALDLMPAAEADRLRLDLARVQVKGDIAHLQKFIDDETAPEVPREVAAVIQAMFQKIAGLLGASAASDAALNVSAVRGAAK